MTGSKGCPYAESPIETRLPYDEISHEVENNVLSLRVGKHVGKIKKVGEEENQGIIEANCEDGEGKKCRPSCVKVKVFPNKPPPPKAPEEEMLLLHTTHQMLNVEEMRNVLELELRTPRNYVPLPGPPLPGPTSGIRSASNDEESEVKPKKKGKKK